MDRTPEQLTNYIDGEQVAPASRAHLDVFEPATGEVYAQAPDSDAADVDAAVRAAAQAFPRWSGDTAQERARLLLALADAIEASTDRFAEAESVDTGKPIALAKSVDIPRSAANLRFFAHAVQHGSGEFHEFDGGHVPASQGGLHALNYTLRRPRGVAGCISPWNLPLYLLTWKIAPALATGNTVVCKPSEVTPYTAWLLGNAAQAAGFGPGVLNIVHGRGGTAGAAIVTDDRVPTVSFTGSTAVGRWIAREAGDRLKRVSLELGGKNPFVVLDDADLDLAVDTAARAAFTNQGQVCLCGSRLLVHERVYDRFVPALLERVRALRTGDPLDPRTTQGALVSREHLAKVDSYVRLARELGGRVLCGGGPVDPAGLPERCRRGWFYAPTLIEGLDPACRVEQEEIFGPVATLQRFSGDDHALALANGTCYGLAASVFTASLARAHRFAADLHAGIVWVNCWMVRDLRTPFGGAKQSGVGREGGAEAIRFFTEPRNICVRV